MKTLYSALATLAVVGLLALPAGAGESGHHLEGMPGMNADMGNRHMEGASDMHGDMEKYRSDMHQGKGKLKSIDLEKGKVSISHGPIKSVGWPAMTMSFKVKDKAQLSKLHPGQQVEFEMMKGEGGQYMITHIKPPR